MSSRQRPMLLAPIALVALLATTAVAQAAQIATCAPGASAVALSSHALAQPFTISTAKDLTAFRVWLSGTGVAHVALEPLTSPEDGSLPMPDDAHRIIEVDLTVATAAPAPITYAPDLPRRLAAGSYAIVVDPPVNATLAWSACGTAGGFMRLDDQTTWGPVPASFAIGVDADEADLTPPTARFLADPAAVVAGGELDLTITASERARFTCTLDDVAVPCGSSGFSTSGRLTLISLSEGPHVVGVVATDVMGNVQVAPHRAAFSVDATPPTTTFALDPPRNGSHDARLHLSASEPATFACSLDGGAPASCVDGDSVTLADQGDHVIVVVATDAVGNVESPGASVAFLADWTAPALTVPAGINTTAPTAAGSDVEYSVTVADDLDPTPSVVCDPASPHRFPVGDTTVECSATDASGNVAHASFLVHVAGPVVRAAEIDISADPTNCALIVLETHGGTVEQPDSSTIVARSAGHETEAALRAQRGGSGDDDPAGQVLRIGSLAYDGVRTTAGRNGYACRISYRHDGSPRRVKLLAFDANGATFVRYSADRGCSIVKRYDATGELIDVARVQGAVVPHLRTDAGTITATT